MIFAAVVDLFRPRAALEAEILVLRQQIVVLRRGKPGRGAIFGSRQNGSRLGLPSISEIPRCTYDRPTRHRGPVASRWFPMLLALEVEAPSGPTSGAA
jgi:hypothetical protein